MQMSEDGERPTMTGLSMSTWMPRIPRGPLSTSIVQIAESRRCPRTSPTPVFMTANRKDIEQGDQDDAACKKDDIDVHKRLSPKFKGAQAKRQ